MIPHQTDRLAYILDKLYSTADAITYLYSPQATLDGQIPADLIHAGRAAAVIVALDRAYNGDYL